jgi:hypothetical protein
MTRYCPQPLQIAHLELIFLKLQIGHNILLSLKSFLLIAKIKSWVLLSDDNLTVWFSHTFLQLG